jgi:hypothetical protein
MAKSPVNTGISSVIIDNQTTWSKHQLTLILDNHQDQRLTPVRAESISAMAVTKVCLLIWKLSGSSPVRELDQPGGCPQGLRHPHPV